MDIEKRLSLFRRRMREESLDFYIIMTADFHGSEYTGEYFKVRQWLSGFTGSNGDLLLDLSEALLWTDGRYFIQAGKELSGSGIKLVRMQEPGAPTLVEYLSRRAGEMALNGGKLRIGFDGRTASAGFVAQLKQALESCGADCELCVDKDLAQGLWEDRPALPGEPVFVLPGELVGKSCGEKLSMVRRKMGEQDCGAHLLTGLDDIMWLLNIRGRDIEFCPLALCYLYLTQREVYLFIDGSKLEGEAGRYLEAGGIQTRPYEEIYSFLEKAGCPEKRNKILLDPDRVNYALFLRAEKGFTPVCAPNPTTAMKAVKDETELGWLREIHIRDGAAFTKFMRFLKTAVAEQNRAELTELTVAQKLEDFRKQQEGYLGPSFETISAYGENAALMHYSAAKGCDAKLLRKGLYLVDSGGQYRGGTTDLTRTIALGEVTLEQRRHFTAVLRGMLNLSDARFLKGCTGRNLDILARGPVWELGLDYKCGTGHGVGYMLNVHEGPQNIRWRASSKTEDAVLEEGMIVTDEPGVYVEGSHGIRLENELVCRRGEKNEYGQFMYFETLTFAPLDLDAVETELLSGREKKRLNAYHRMVREKLWDRLEAEERDWLLHYTRPV